MSIYVQDVNGCKNKTSELVADVPGPTDLQLSTTPAACGNNNGSIIVNNVIGGTAPYEYSTDGTNFQSSNTFSGLTAGSYSVGVRDNNGCRYETSTTVSNAGGPTGITYSITTAGCSNDDGEIRVVSVDNGTSPYQYSIDGVNFQSSLIFAGLASGNYTLTARDANGCIYSVAVTVTSEAPSSVQANSTSASCSQANGTIVIQSVIGGTAPYTFSIDGSLFQTGPSFSNVAPGTYTVTARDDRGCLVATEVTVNDVPGPIDLQMTTTGATCGDANGSLTVDLVVGGTTPYQHSIDGINFQASNQFTGIRSGAYNITVRDANNCQYSEVVGVSDTPGPNSVSYSTTEALCNNNTGTLTVDQVVGGAAPFTYAIDNGPFQASPTLVNLTGGAHILSVKDANGCVLATTVNIANTQGPVDFSFLVSQASCGSNNGVITITSVVGGTAPNMFAIDGGSFQSGLSFGGRAAGSYVVTVRDNNGCLLSKNIIVTNSGGPSAITYMINESNCDSNDGSIQVTSVFGGDLPYEFSLDGINYQPSGNFNGLAFGDYVVFVRDNLGCIYLEPMTVPANGPDNVNFTLTHSLCNLSTGSLTVGNVVGGTAPYQYSVDGVSYQISTNFNNLSQGMYQLYVRDDKGCILIEDFEINDVPGPQDLEYTVVDATCGDGNGSITIDNIIGGTAPFQYSLDGGPYQAGASFANLFSGLYNITVLDANNCSLTISIQVNNQTGPLANLQSTTPVSCFGGSDGVVEVSASSSGTLEYSINNGTTFQSSPIFNGLAAGNYTVIVRDQSGCSSSVDSITVNQPELLQAEATIAKQPNTGLSDGIIELSNIEGGVPPYSSFLNGETMGPETSFENLASGPYTITLVDQNQCQVSFELLMESEFPEIEVPNGFTPNGDGRNDTWEISQLSQFYPNAEILVFNRWGQVVFSSLGYSNPWNGTRGGQQLPTTTYYYLIKLNEGLDPLQGTVTIIR